MRVTSAGNVGIGTSSPAANLEVVGLSKFGTGGQASMELSWDNGTLISPLANLNSSSGGLIKAPFQGNLIMQIRGNHFDDGLMVVTDKNLDGTPDAIPFKVLSNGNVGVGRSMPTQQFHVNNDVSGSDSSFVVTTDGKVGIGTSSPLTDIHISKNQNNTTGSANIWLEGFNNGYANASIVFQSNHSILNKRATGLFFFDSFGQNEWFVGRPYAFNSNLTPNDEFVIQRQNTTTHSEISSALIDGSGNQTNVTRFFVVKNNGNTGIGTATPARTLHINAVMRLEPISSAPTSPAKGDMYFDSTINKLRVYDGTTWQSCW
jgi:hypothetical protein